MSQEAPEDLNLFCRQVYPRLVGALTLYVGGRETAEELAQESLLRAIARWETVRQLEFPEGWVHRVGMNLANSWFRRLAVARRRNIAANQDTMAWDVDVALQVRQVVSVLPKRQRAAVVLRYYLDLPTAQAAELLGVSPAAFRQLTHRALVNLAPLLGNEEDSADEEANCAR